MQKENTQSRINEEKILTSKTGRFYTFKTGDEPVKTIWFVLHGYGQKAENFINLFTELPLSNTMFVAPEALNKFYLKGFAGKVGASWMTKEAREIEIKDYVNYLNNIYMHVTAGMSQLKLTVNVLGFSQGAATATRWVLSQKFKPDNLILWGGALPRDIDIKRASLFFKSTKLSIVIGKEDEFLRENEICEEEKYLKENRIEYKLYQYHGKHEIDDKALKELLSETTNW